MKRQLAACGIVLAMVATGAADCGGDGKTPPRGPNRPRPVKTMKPVHPRMTPVIKMTGEPNCRICS